MEDNIQMRWVIRRDVPEILAIETDSFEFSWSEEDFLRCLRQRNCIGLVAETLSADGQGGNIVGYVMYELLKDQIHVHNFAVDRKHRRQGIGRKMLSKLVSKLTSHRRHKISLDTRESNLPAQLFFSSCGFMAISVLRSHYGDTDEDAYHFVYDLDDAKSIGSVNNVNGEEASYNGSDRY